MSETDWKQHFMNIANGKVRKKQKYCILNQIDLTQQVVQMAKDQIKVIKALTTASCGGFVLKLCSK